MAGRNWGISRERGKGIKKRKKREKKKIKGGGDRHTEEAEEYGIAGKGVGKLDFGE